MYLGATPSALATGPIRIAAGITFVALFNRKDSPRPVVGGQGTGRFLPGVGWYLLGSSIAHLIVQLIQGAAR